jgi:hypothetical protein
VLSVASFKFYVTSNVHILLKYSLNGHITLKLQLILKMYSIECVIDILSITYIYSRISKSVKSIKL